MNITRRFTPQVADSIEEVERAVIRGDAMPQTYSCYLAALLICEDDGSFRAAEAMLAAKWMSQLGALTWSRKNGETVVTFRECLN